MRPARSPKLLLSALILALAPLLGAQDGFPHLTLQDAVNPPVPAPGSTFDNSHVFQAFSGKTFQVRVEYDSPVQPNNNVFWGVLVSLAQTPFPTSLQPPDFTPPLFTMPPFVLVLPQSPTLTVAGTGEATLFVPAGLLALDAYVQALVFDAPHVPALRLSNGVKVEVEVPDFSVRFAFLRNLEGAGEAVMDAAGYIDIDGDTLKTLKPVGVAAPPQYVPVEPPVPGTAVESENVFEQPYRFLDIVANTPDEPVNPLARPITTIVGGVDATSDVIPVADTSFFPPSGRLVIAFGAGNLFANKVGNKSPDCEVVLYDGVTPTSFLNCQRAQVGSSATVASLPHAEGQQVLGDYTMATTAGARQRTRIGLDVDNPDLPHVVIPAVTYDGGEGVGLVTHDVDLYRYELINPGVQGFGVMDRTTGRFRRIEDSEKTVSQGPYYPMVCIAPDGRSMVVAQVVSGGTFGWDNNPDRLFAIRLDGLPWPATGSEVWEINYQQTIGPTAPPSFEKNVRSRRFIMRSTAIIGPDPDNYVLFAGLADKWVKSEPTPGGGAAPHEGFEARYVREEVLVHDLIDCPLTPPGSSKAVPSMPRLYIVPSFGTTGTNKIVRRFDPEFLVSPDAEQILLVAGNRDIEEDAFIIRDVGVTDTGSTKKTIVNISGFLSLHELRAFTPGGHGQGRRAAFSSDGKRVAFLSADGPGAQSRMDFLNIALTTGASYGQVQNVYADASGNFKETGPLGTDRAIMGLTWLDDHRVAFLMGRAPYEDPFGTTGGFTPGTDLFVYDLTTDVMTNVSGTGGSASGFGEYGTIHPAGTFRSPSGEYSFVLDFGVAGAGSSLPAGTPVRDVFGLDHASATTFPITGDGYGGGSLVPHLDLPEIECLAPVETAAAMRFVEAGGVQEGMLYFAAHVKGGNGGDELITVNRDAPFVSLQATSSAKPGTHLSNISPSVSSGKVAYARTDTATKQAANQHPFIVDLDHFLFERDVLPTWSLNGGFLGRVMDGSLHIVPPEGSAGEGLVFCFGLVAQPTYGVAQIAAPAYYPLSSVSDTLAEPIPVVIPLIDTLLLGADFRFYVTWAGPSASN
jgi:hypothetical protein